MSKIKNHRTLVRKVEWHYLNLNFLISKGGSHCQPDWIIRVTKIRNESVVISPAMPLGHSPTNVEPSGTGQVQRYKAAQGPLEGLRGKEDAPCPWASGGSTAHPIASSWPLPSREIRSRGWGGLVGWAGREGRRGLAEEAIPNTPVGWLWLQQLGNSPDLDPRWQWPEVGWKAVAP